MMIGAGGTAMADVYPAGVACQDFAVEITSNGNPVGFSGDGTRGKGLVFAGTGVIYTYKNLTTGTTWSPGTSPAAAGASLRQRPGPNGSTFFTINGSTGLIMFPTDIPQGPATTWHTGRLVLEFDSLNNTRIISFVGKKVDICAELAD